MMPSVSVIVVNWNTRNLLEQCLRSVYETAEDMALEVIVVDNASADGSVEMVRDRFPQVRLLENGENVGFARANNQGVAISQGRYVLLLNSDAFLTAHALQSLVELAEAEPGCGIVGAQLRNVDGSFQASHTPFPNLWREFIILSGIGRLLYGRRHPSRGPEGDKGSQIVDYVEGACLLVRRKAFEEVGGLDEGYFMYAEEVDLCYAMKEKGWQVWYQPAAKVTHLGGGSSQNRATQREADLYRSRMRFFRKYYGTGQARLLKWQILGLTLIKTAFHGLLRLVSGGRYGRRVVPLRDLAMGLRKA